MNKHPSFAAMVATLAPCCMADGKAFVKERVELAQSRGTFWQDYKFTNPINKKIEPKSVYCEKLEDTAVCGGSYKQVALSCSAP